MQPFRIGFGFDVHQLKDNHPFWLGGVPINHIKGAFGHSDADALIHAICDALLGAAALGDIGHHFPDSDASYKNIDSKILLAKTIELLNQNKYNIGNIDITIVLEKPKIKPYIENMRTTLSEVMKIQISQLSIKATTNETMGFIGRQEGIAAYAIALIYQDFNLQK